RSDPLERSRTASPGSLAIETVDINDAGTVRALRERLSGRSDPLERSRTASPGSLAIETVDINDAGTVRALR
ncbi:hypothetical protein CTI14_71370, partial [Methylobacterium radiotolerans]